MRIYEEGEYVIERNAFPKGRLYKVINTLDRNKNLHTHLRTEKAARNLVHFAINKKIPLSAEVDFLISLKRILIDIKLIGKVEALIKIKQSKLEKEKSAGRRKRKVCGYK